MLKRMKDIVQKLVLSRGYMIVPDCNVIRSYNPAFYSEDGIYTQHNHDFMKEQNFITANNAGLIAQLKSGFQHGNAWRIHIALQTMGWAKNLEGAFIECGTWYGRTMKTGMVYHDGLHGHQVVLIDTFSGMVEDQLTGAEKGRAHQDELNDYYSNPSDQWYKDVCETFMMYPNVEVIQGVVPDVFEKIKMPDQIAFLHLDMNAALPEYEALCELYDKIVSGGVILLDDYAYANMGEQYRIHNKFAQEHGFEFMSLPTGQGIYVKNV